MPHRPARALTRLVAASCLTAAVVPWITQGTAAAAGVSVPAPGAGPAATVTVSKVDDLTNESVTVSWTGFTPSSAQQLNNSTSADTSTTAPVRVYECRGAAPDSSADCYGSPGFRGVPANGDTPAIPAVPAFTYPGQTDPYASTPDGPANWQDVATGPDGTGQVTLQVFTRRESAALGCDATAPCSLVVVPNYGRANGSNALEEQLDAPWAWERRTVVPLAFLPLDDSCPLGRKALSVEGSPAAGRLLASWRAIACTQATSPVTVDYTSIGEPQTRADVADGLSDVGLLTQPLEVDAQPKHPLAYAPVSLTSLAVGFQVDDANGKPVDRMRLNARLVAKLITASYRVADDPGVLGNPRNLFRDPEFLALNPGTAWPSGAPGNHVLLLGDLSDATATLTRWIDADPTARGFLDGTPDAYGMHVNSAYKKIALPVSTFPLLDQVQQDSFQPIQGLDDVARQLSLSQFPGAVSSVEGGITVVTKPNRQPAGRRETVGIIDTAQARAFRIPTASLLNASGAYVQPDDGGLTAAAKALRIDARGSLAPLALTAKDAAAYPLLLPIQAAVPRDAKGTLRDNVVRLLDYVLGPGQVRGDALGQLPAGYLPLTPALRAQAVSARASVLAGVAPVLAPVKPAAPPVALPQTVTPPVKVPVTVVLPGVVKHAAPPTLQVLPPTIAPATPVLPARLVSASELSGSSSVVPSLLLAGLVALLAGPAALVLTRRGLLPSWLTS